MGFDYNFNWQERDRLIWNDETDWENGADNIRRFEDMPLATLKQLLELEFADPEDRQNDAPTIEEFVEFAERMTDCVVTFNGYAVTPLDPDEYRVSIEAVLIAVSADNTTGSIPIATAAAIADFACRSNDVNYLTNEQKIRIWWD